MWIADLGKKSRWSGFAIGCAPSPRLGIGTNFTHRRTSQSRLASRPVSCLSIFSGYQEKIHSRCLDFLVRAKDSAGRDQAIIVELKQWETCEESDAEDLVASYLGGRLRDVLHPSVQVGQYHQYLKDNNSAFYDEPDPVGLDAC